MSVHVKKFRRAIVESMTAKKDKLRIECSNLLVKYGDLECDNMQLQTKVALLEDMLQRLQLGKPK